MNLKNYCWRIEDDDNKIIYKNNTVSCISNHMLYQDMGKGDSKDWFHGIGDDLSADVHSDCISFL